MEEEHITTEQINETPMQLEVVGIASNGDLVLVPTEESEEEIPTEEDIPDFGFNNDPKADANTISRDSAFIIGNYLKDIKDLVNLEKCCKKFRSLFEQYTCNPVPLNSNKERNLFPRLRTYRCFGDSDIKELERFISYSSRIKNVIIYNDDENDEEKYDDFKQIQLSENDYETVDGKQVHFYEYSGPFEPNMNPNIIMLKGVSPTVNLSSITIPTHISELAEHCFDGEYYPVCQNIKEITIPRTIGSLSLGLFNKCGITRVNLPNSIKIIPAECFYGCRDLTSIDIPTSVKYINHEAFSHCTSLTGITLPDSVKYISNECFKCCYSLKTVVITSRLTRIGDKCFEGASSLKHLYTDDNSDTQYSVDIPSTVTSLGEGVFQECVELTSLNFGTDIPVPTSFCYRCYELREIRIDDQVTKIGSFAFGECQALKKVHLPLNLRILNCDTFKFCTSLESIILPDTLYYVGDGCFDDCYSLNNFIMSRALRTYIETHPSDFNCLLDYIEELESQSDVSHDIGEINPIKKDN